MQTALLLLPQVLLLLMPIYISDINFVITKNNKEEDKGGSKYPVLGKFVSLCM